MKADLNIILESKELLLVLSFFYISLNANPGVEPL